MIDVRLTQANLGLFFPLFNFSPSISAHARAGLQGEASTSAAPIAVGDTGNIPCVSVRLVNATTNALIQTVTLAKEPPDPLNPDGAGPVGQRGRARLLHDADLRQRLRPAVPQRLQRHRRRSTTTAQARATRPHGPADDQQPPVERPDGHQWEPAADHHGWPGRISARCANGTQYFAPLGADCTVEVDARVAFAPNVGNNGSVTLRRAHVEQPGRRLGLDHHAEPHASLARERREQVLRHRCLLHERHDSPIRAALDQFSLNWSQTTPGRSDDPCGTGNGQQPPPCTGQFNNGAILQQVVRRLQRLRPARRLGADRLLADQRGQRRRRHHRQRHEQLRRRLDAQPRLHVQALRPQHGRTRGPTDRPALRELDQPSDRARRLRAGQRREQRRGGRLLRLRSRQSAGPRHESALRLLAPARQRLQSGDRRQHDGLAERQQPGLRPDDSGPAPRRNHLPARRQDRQQPVRHQLHRRRSRGNVPGQQLVDDHGSQTSRQVTRARSDDHHLDRRLRGRRRIPAVLAPDPEVRDVLRHRLGQATSSRNAQAMRHIPESARTTRTTGPSGATGSTTPTRPAPPTGRSASSAPHQPTAFRH